MIPDWNSTGVLPPLRPGAAGHSPDRSPYRISLSQVVERFATSPERISILHGLLDYRRQLREKAGITTGFQWLDGSFLENKEVLEGTAPKDIDVVTFFDLPPNTSQEELLTANRDLFDPESTKKLFLVDGYPFVLGNPLTPPDVRQISYWYSMWSHRRNLLWKGFVQVDVARDDDEVASELLKQIEREGGTR
jgi:hypothetical protein